jgi:ribokinase
VVALGSRGAFVVDRGAGAEEWVGAHEVATVDTVGAGDAFCGSLAASLASGAELVDAVRLANAAGALSTTVNGAADSAPDRAAAPRAGGWRNVFGWSAVIVRSFALDRD